MTLTEKIRNAVNTNWMTQTLAAALVVVILAVAAHYLPADTVTGIATFLHNNIVSSTTP